MKLTRRQILRASAAVVAAPGLSGSALASLKQILDGQADAPVVWLQGQSCSGCSISLLNSIHDMSVDELLLETIDLKYHPTLMAAAGQQAVNAAQRARDAGGYILVIEGSIPTGEAGQYCTVWAGKTMQQATHEFAANARFILAVGTCAAYGGLVAAGSNPTNAQSVGQLLGGDDRIVNIPGCPSHPDWIVGTIAYILDNGRLPPLDDRVKRRPAAYFSDRIHDVCPLNTRLTGDTREAECPGEAGCMEEIGCRGKETYADCAHRRWNSSGKGKPGVNWCIGARSPCQGCVEPTYPGSQSFWKEYDD
jgi:NiFe hydrogenase small subunit HydA